MVKISNFNGREGGKFRFTTLFFILFILLLGFVSYASSMGNDFVWDDEYLVLKNGYIRDISFVAGIFRQDLLYSNFRQSNSYRPMQFLSYMLDYYMSGLNPGVFHFINVLLHLINAVLICFILQFIFKNKILSLVAGLVFAVHPVHTQATSYIAGRADILMGNFILASFLLFITRDKNKYLPYALSLILFVLALLSKEAAVVFPFALLMYVGIFKKETGAARSTYPFFAILGGFVFIRISTLNTGILFTANLSIYERALLFTKSIIYYIQFLTVPFGLHPLRTVEPAHTIFDFSVLMGASLIALLLYFAIKNLKKSSLAPFSIAWFFIWLVPVSGIVPLNATIAEHWLYLPSIGFFVIFGAMISSVLNSRAVILIKGAAASIFCAIIILLVAVTYKQNTYWHNEQSIYERILLFSPRNAVVYNNLGVRYQKNKNEKEAFSLFNKAKSLDPNYPYAYYNIGAYYYTREDLDGALENFNKCIGLKPNFSDAHVYCGIIFDKQGKFDASVVAYKKAIRANPNNAKAHVNLGDLYAKNNMAEPALMAYDGALDTVTVYTQIYEKIGIVFVAVDSPRKAIKAFRKAIKIDRNLKTAYLNLGNIYMNTGKYKDGIAVFKKAIKIDPAYKEAHYNLGNLYNETGELDNAVLCWKKALEIDPHYSYAIENLNKAGVK